LQTDHARQWLRWAAQLHEIGLVIAHSQYHRHGAYLLEHADLPGFSLRDQRLLGALVNCHRRKIRKPVIAELPRSVQATAVRMCILLRLAVLLHRSRSDSVLPEIGIQADAERLILNFPDDWLEQHPLTQADLKIERKYLKNTGVRLELN